MNLFHEMRRDGITSMRGINYHYASVIEFYKFIHGSDYSALFLFVFLENYFNFFILFSSFLKKIKKKS